MGDVSINYEDHVEGIMFVYKLNITQYHGNISWDYIYIYQYIYIFVHQYHGNIMFVGYISHDLPMISPCGRKARERRQRSISEHLERQVGCKILALVRPWWLMKFGILPSKMMDIWEHDEPSIVKTCDSPSGD
jgi:hypothetical protein